MSTMDNHPDAMLNLRGAADLNHGEDDDSGVSFATFTSILKYVALILVAPVITFFAAKTALDHTLRVTT